MSKQQFIHRSAAMLLACAMAVFAIPGGVASALELPAPDATNLITITESGEYTLATDTTADIVVSGDAQVTIDFGGHTLTSSSGPRSTVTVNDAANVMLVNGSIMGGSNRYTLENSVASTLTVRDIKAQAGNNGSSLVDNWGTLTIDSGEFTGGLNVLKNEPRANLTVNGGTFTLTSTANGISGVLYNYGTATLNDGSFIQSDTSSKYGNAQVLVTDIDKNDPSTPQIYVKGGSYTNKASKAASKIVHRSGAAGYESVSISGGTFSAATSRFAKVTSLDNYLVEGATVVKRGNPFFVCTSDAITAASVKSGDTVYPKSTAPVASAQRIAGALPSDLVLKGGASVTSYTVSDAAKTKENAAKVVASQDGVIYFTTEKSASSFVTAAQKEGEAVEAAPAHVTITFVDGDKTVEERKLDYGDPFGTLPAMTDRDDADFEAWIDDSDGDELGVSENWIARSDMTIKAKWSHMNTVTFVSRGTVLETRRIHDGEAVGELPAIEEVAGYTVEGWFDSEDADANKVDESLVPTQNLTLYAKWTKNRAKPSEDTPGTGADAGDAKKDDKTDASMSKKVKGDLPRTGDMALALPLVIAAAGIAAIVVARFIAKRNSSVR